MYNTGGIILRLFQTLNLEDYFNHKIVGNEQEVRSTGKLENFGVKNNLFLPDKFPESFEKSEIPFANNKILKSEEYDNIQCEAQKIKIHLKQASKIFFLGFCECGDIGETIRLDYSINEIVENKLFFYDWLVTNLDERWDYDVWNQNCSPYLEAHVSTNKRRRIYQYECPLKVFDKDLDSIILPYNPLLHILAITVEQGGDKQ